MKWLPAVKLKIAEEKQKATDRRKKITQANTEFQKRPRRYEELYLNRQYKEIKDNNQIEKKNSKH